MKKKVPELIKILIAGLTSTLAFIAFVAALIMAYINLKTYAVYYAEHTPHADNVDPVAIEVLDNLQWNTFPKDSSYGADFDGKNTIQLLNLDGDEVEASLTSWPHEIGNKYSFHYINKDDISYILDSNLNIIQVSDTKLNSKTKFTEEEKAKYKQEVRQFLDPLIDAQPKPLIFNLQLLYDLLNHDRFN